jgi:hypothetical protein
MTSSASSAVKGLLAGYLAGRVPVERLVPALAAEYYRSVDAGTRSALRPVMEVIERAAPGVGRLARTEGGAGFEISLAERPFPSSDQTALRDAVTAVLASAWAAGAEVSPVGAVEPGTVASPGFLARVVRAVRRLFSASA